MPQYKQDATLAEVIDPNKKFPSPILSKYDLMKTSIIADISNVSEPGYLYTEPDGNAPLSTLPFMDSLSLAAYLGAPLSLLYAFLAKDTTSYGYYQFYIDKETKKKVEFSEGLKLRKINAPCRGLKHWQQKIQNVLVRYFPVNPCNFGFLKGKNTIMAAAAVKDGETLIHFDYSNFFPSHTSLYIMGKLQVLFAKYWPAINEKERRVLSYIISRICCKGAELPQGSPASPILTCILNTDLDERLTAIADAYGLRYVRYGDDLAFAGKIEKHLLQKFISQVEDASHPFLINYKKLNIMSDKAYHIVKGLRIQSNPKKYFPPNFSQRIGKLAALELKLSPDEFKVRVTKGKITIMVFKEENWTLSDITSAIMSLQERLNNTYSESMKTQFKVKPLFYYIQGIKHVLGVNLNNSKISVSRRKYEDLRLLAMLMGIQRAYQSLNRKLKNKNSKFPIASNILRLRLEAAADAVHAPDGMKREYRNLLKHPMRRRTFNGKCNWIGQIDAAKKEKLKAIEQKFYEKYKKQLATINLGLQKEVM